MNAYNGVGVDGKNKVGIQRSKFIQPIKNLLEWSVVVAQMTTEYVCVFAINQMNETKINRNCTVHAQTFFPVFNFLFSMKIKPL